MAKGYTEWNLYVTFNTVNSGVNKVFVGSNKVSQRRNGKAQPPHISAKAIDIDIAPNPYTPRIEAIEQLLHKVRKGDRVRIFTTDQHLIDITKADKPEAAEAVAIFNKMAEGLTIQVIHPDEDQDYLETNTERLSVAAALMKIRENTLLTQGDDLKSYRRHRPQPPRQ